MLSLHADAASLGFDDLPDKINVIKQEMEDEYKQHHEKPWIVGFSAGKDSTLLLQLVFEMLLELPPSARSRPIHVLSNDTLVESPMFQTFVDEVLVNVESAADGLRLPIKVVKTTPGTSDTFWVNLIGRGYPAPNRLFRWCTDRMKIRPTTKYIAEQVSSAGEVILLLGVRRSESSARAKNAKRYDNGGRLNTHNDIKGCKVYRPILELATDEVWTVLTLTRPPWGGDHRDLMMLYKNAQGGECPLIVDKSDVPSCGTSSARFGCWTCTVVEKDRSIMGLIESGFQDLAPLATFRDWLKEYSRDPANRMAERRNGQEGLGPFTIAARQTILDRLLRMESIVGRQLISRSEIAHIEQIWDDDRSLMARNRASRVLAMIEQP